MINFNGELKEELGISCDNRALKYGDGVFETIKVQNKKLVFFEDHYFRLMASMRMLRMKIPMEFTLEFLQKEILNTVNTLENSLLYRVRLSVFRKDGGLYTPNTNEIDYLIEAKAITVSIKPEYKIDLFKDFYNYSGLLSTIKTNNRMINILASVFANENELDNSVILNERKGVVELTNSNIFLIKGTTVVTPSLEEGCVKGIVRKKVIEQLTKSEHYTIEERAVSPFEIQKSDEVFITNSIVGIQPVTQYRKKKFGSDITQKFIKILKVLALTS